MERAGWERERYERDRSRMVEEQLARRGISDPRAAGHGPGAAASLRREALRDRAYGDHPLPIGEQQTISQPYIVALMTSLLHLSGQEKVLEIGTGSGYRTAILALLARACARSSGFHRWPRAPGPCSNRRA